MSASVVVSTPSRLHFGLLRFAQVSGPSYGGLGMMIDSPRWTIEVRAADRWQASGPEAERALEVARRAVEQIAANNRPAAIELQVRSAIPEHCGLGGGTQLALAVAAAVRALAGLPPGTAEELATSADRGERSAVGSHGFVHGGLLWETGRLPGEALGRLANRVAVPTAWRVVLVTPRAVRGLSGIPEREAFETLPPVPEVTAAQLTQLAEAQILPAAERGDINAFGEGVYDYGRLAGECFAPVQGGAYASPEIAASVAAIRDLGVCGVGQSSWGPTIFAIVDGDAAAQELVAEIREHPRFTTHDTTVAAPDNLGAAVTRHSAPRVD